MTFDYLKHLKSTNQTIKLLSSDNFAFMLGFFHFVFMQCRHSALPYSQILVYLDDYLYDINQSNNNPFPKTAKEYLDDFSNDKNAYLRKYHGDDDETLYELTPHISKALEFVESLQKSEFVGSRSKFNIIFELLEELEFETHMDDRERIATLEEQKRSLDRQIDSIRDKKDLRFDSARIKEHYMQIDEMVRKLKYDFSEMEYNFRDLNRLAMEEIALRDDAKSGVLDAIFDIEDSIRHSDQGKSFFAFWQLLTDTQKSQKLTELLENLYKIETIKALDEEKKLQDVKYTLLKSGEKIYKVSAKLIEQLRRFIDDRIWIENKRVLELCREIEKSAIVIKEDMPTARDFFAIKGDRVPIDSIFEKSLYTVKEAQVFKKEERVENIEIDMSSFYHIFFVDEERLKKNIAQMLIHQSQCTLTQLTQRFAIRKGVSELISYLSIAKNSADSIIDECHKIRLEIEDSDGQTKIITLANVIFTKGVKK
jgi:hypothetical protein